jgi:1,4-dihydroxy-2-naphthoate octaprenyltransferase
MAARPKTLYAAAAPVLMGGGLAYDGGVFAPGPFLAALVCALLIQIGTNLANDYSDYVRGADTPDRKGFTRVAQAGLVSPTELRRAIALVFGASVALGAYLVSVGGLPILLIGLASIAAGLAYTGGPWPFGYYGLGDLFVFVFFGFVAVLGTYYVQALELRADLWLAGGAAGALVTAILVVNNLRDLDTDARTGKRTLAVHLGNLGTQIEYSILLAVGFAAPLIGIALGAWPTTALLSLVALPFAVTPLRGVWCHRDPTELNAALAGTSRLAGTYGLLFAIGLIV